MEKKITIDELLKKALNPDAEKQLMNVKYSLAMLCADIDIFLLMEDDQETDKNKMFTTEEIRNQLEKSMSKLANMLTQIGVDIEKPFQCNKITIRETLDITEAIYPDRD